MGRELHAAGTDVVHPSDDLNSAGLLELAQHRTLLADAFDDVPHVAPGHVVDDFLARLAGRLDDIPTDRLVDRGADVFHDELQMKAAGADFRAVLSEAVDGLGDGAAARVAEDEDQLRAASRAAIFDASDDFPADDVAGDANAKDVAESEIENDFGRGAGINTAQDDGQWMLTGCGLM